MRKNLFSNVARGAFFIIYLLAATAILALTAFAVIDSTNVAMHPRLQRFAYFRTKARYELDSELVYRYRPQKHHFRSNRRGLDQFREGMAELPDQPYEATYSETGFRINSSIPPYDVAVIGDSFVATSGKRAK